MSALEYEITYTLRRYRDGSDEPEETVDTDIRQVVECMETVFHPKGGIPIPFPVGVGPTGAENFRDASH